MAKWIEVLRCKKCLKVYRFGKVPIICGKCGVKLTRHLFGNNYTIPETCEKVIARRRFLWFEVKETNNG